MGWIQFGGLHYFTVGESIMRVHGAVNMSKSGPPRVLVLYSGSLYSQNNPFEWIRESHDLSKRNRHCGLWGWRPAMHQILETLRECEMKGDFSDLRLPVFNSQVCNSSVLFTDLGPSIYILAQSLLANHQSSFRVLERYFRPSWSSELSQSYTRGNQLFVTFDVEIDKVPSSSYISHSDVRWTSALTPWPYDKFLSGRYSAIWVCRSIPRQME